MSRVSVYIRFFDFGQLIDMNWLKSAFNNWKPNLFHTCIQSADNNSDNWTLPFAFFRLQISYTISFFAIANHSDTVDFQDGIINSFQTQSFQKSKRQNMPTTAPKLITIISIYLDDKFLIK